MAKRYPSLVDVARLAGTSPYTASRVLSGKRQPGRGVKPEVYHRVRDAAKQLGYRPNHSARSLIKRRAFAIGYAIRAVDYLRQLSSFTQIMAGVVACSAQHGQNVQFLITTKPAKENIFGNYYLDKVAERSVDGVVLFDLAMEAGGLRYLRQNEVPFAFLDGLWPAIEDRCILLDRKSVGRRAFSYLRSLGHERPVAFIRTVAISCEPEERMASGFVEAAREAGIEAAEELVVRYEPEPSVDLAADPEISWAADHYARLSNPTGWDFFPDFVGHIDRVLSGPRSPTAFFVDTDTWAQHLMYRLGQRGLRVPEDVAVVGFGDDQFAMASVPKLTTFRVPWYDMGFAATEFVLRLVEDRSALPPPPIPCELVVRESCGGRKPNGR